MPTPNVNLRIPDELKEPALQHGRELGLGSFTDCVHAALRAWIPGNGVPRSDPALRQAIERAERAEAEAARLRADLARFRALAAGVPAPDAGTSRTDLLAAAIMAATAEVPVTRKHMIAMSGLDSTVVDARLAWLRSHGYVTQPRGPRSPYVPVPGMDIRKGLDAALADDAAEIRERRGGARVTAAASTVPPAPRHVRPLSPGTAVFREPGASPVVGALAPEGKRGRR